MNSFVKSLIIFLFVNFGGLAIGGLFTNAGVSSEWYDSLNKAPWTPPGWVFGAAWTIIMICFSVYMALLYQKLGKSVLGLFILSLLLNVIWNPVFFYQKWVVFGLIVISSLAILITSMMVKHWNILKSKSLLILPYFLWLCIATSLNAYILVYN